MSKLKSVECLACVARVGRALHGVCQALASWLVNETGISCKAMEQVDEHVFVVIYGTKDVIVPHENLSPNPGMLMVRHGIQYFSGYTYASEPEVSVGGRKAGKWE